jgi:hypothetical protein
VKIQPEERLATISELNLAPSLVTGCSEAKGMGYWAATQVKGLSPEIPIVSVADVLQLTEGRTLIAVNPSLVSCNFGKSAGILARRCEPDGVGDRGTVSKGDCRNSGGPKCSPKWGYVIIKPIDGKTLQMTLWESDQFIVPKKQGNA